MQVTWSNFHFNNVNYYLLTYPMLWSHKRIVTEIFFELICSGSTTSEFKDGHSNPDLSK